MIFIEYQLEDAGVVMVTDPVHFGPVMLKLLGRKQPWQGASGVGLGQVGFADIPIFPASTFKK